MPNYTADASTPVGNSYNAPSLDAFIRTLLQGVPIARNYVPTTPETEIYRRNYPDVANAQSTAAGIAAVAPLALAAPATIPVQAGLGAAINTADALTSNETHSPETLAIIAALGGTLGAAGPAATHIGRTVQRATPNADLSLPTSLFSTSWRDLNGPHAWGAGAAMAGELAAGNPYLGLAGVAAPYAASAIGRATSNLTPQQKALLNILGQGANQVVVD